MGCGASQKYEAGNKLQLFISLDGVDSNLDPKFIQHVLLQVFKVSLDVMTCQVSSAPLSSLERLGWRGLWKHLERLIAKDVKADIYKYIK